MPAGAGMAAELPDSAGGEDGVAAQAVSQAQNAISARRGSNPVEDVRDTDQFQDQQHDEDDPDRFEHAAGRQLLEVIGQ